MSSKINKQITDGEFKDSGDKENNCWLADFQQTKPEHVVSAASYDKEDLESAKLKLTLLKKKLQTPKQPIGKAKA